MKRDPSDIMVDILHTLNVLTKDKEYSINNISKQSKTHWATVHKYLQMIDLVQKFAPEIEFTGQNKTRIRRFPESLHLDNQERLLLYLFERKAFDSESSVSIPQSMAKEAEFFISKKCILLTADNYAYLLDSGKQIVLDLYLEIKDKIYEKIPIRESDSLIETEPNEIELLKQNILNLVEYTNRTIDFIRSETLLHHTDMEKRRDVVDLVYCH